MNTQSFKKAVVGVILCGVTTFAAATGVDPNGPWYNLPNGGSPLAHGQTLIAQGGDVMVTFLGPTSAGYDEDLYIASPANVLGHFFNNHTAPHGQVVDLGSYAAGTEIEFGLDVLSTGETWFDGDGSRNTDGFVHAYMVNNYEGLANTTYVGFEDLDGSSFADWNYTDDVFAFSGVQAASTVPDSSVTLPLLGAGLLGLAAFARRLKK